MVSQETPGDLNRRLIMADAHQLAQDIYDDLGDDADATLDEIEDKIAGLLEYDVPADEAEATVRRQYTTQSNSTGSTTDQAEPAEKKIGEIDTDGRVTIDANVTHLFDQRDGDPYDQIGVLDDGTDSLIFKKWSSDLPTLEEDTAYRFENVRVDRIPDDVDREDEFDLNLNASTTITERDTEVDETITFTAPIVGLENGSGLIKRCPVDDCSRTLGKQDRCQRHGEPGPNEDPVKDLRIKAIADTGTDVKRLYFGQDETADLTGLTIDDAVELAREELDSEAVATEISDQIVGKYYTVEIRGKYQGYLIVDDWTELSDENHITEDAQAVQDELAAVATTHESSSVDADAETADQDTDADTPQEV